MGKNQHSKDGLHLRPTEWSEDGRGFKVQKRSPFAQLPLNCCFLSLQPFDQPVGTRDGSVFDIKNILGYIKRFGLHPVTGGKLEKSELLPLHFHSNAEGKLHCPVTFKVFGNHTHVVLNLKSGHIYSFEAVDQLNRKTRNWKDLMTSEPFVWADIVTIQDPDFPEGREISKFYFIQQGQQDEVVQEITNPESKAARAAKEKEDKLRENPAVQRILDEKKRIAEEQAKELAAKEAAEDDETKAKKAAALAESQRPRKTNERYTNGEVAESFTSTKVNLKTQNNLRLLTQEEELQELYDSLRKKKAKGYVRIVTSAGMLNAELHCDMAPRTTDNFLRLCEKNYYDNTIFHRLVRNFVLQGGDPTGTGKGGKSGFDDGAPFKDEFDSRLTHQGPGILSMANSGKNTNRSQFFVSLKSCQHLDLKHSVFGRIVGGLQLLDVFNDWEVDGKDRPVKEIKLIRTEVFKNPFKEAIAEAAKPKVEVVVDPVATWFSNRKDPMEEHKNRNASTVGKYLPDAAPPLPGEKRKKEELPAEEVEYATVVQKSKKLRTAFDFSAW